MISCYYGCSTDKFTYFSVINLSLVLFLLKNCVWDHVCSVMLHFSRVKRSFFVISKEKRFLVSTWFRETCLKKYSFYTNDEGRLQNASWCLSSWFPNKLGYPHKKYHREILVSFPSLVFLWFCRYPCPPLFSVSFVIKDRFCDLCVRPWQEKWCCPPHPVTDLFETRPAALKKLLTNISTLQSYSRIFRKSCKISGKVCNFEKYWTLRVILGVIDDQHDAILQFARLLAVYLWCD